MAVTYPPIKALERLILHFKQNMKTVTFACEMIALKLNRQWTPKHIYHIYTGRSPATPQFKAKISQLDYKIRNPHRIWLGINALSMEQKERWKLIPMEVRRVFLDQAYNAWARDNLKCDNACAWVQPYGWAPEAGCPMHDPDPPGENVDSKDNSDII